MYKPFAVTLAALLLIAPVWKIHAQTINPNDIIGSFSLVVVPKTPVPGEPVKVFVEAPGLDVFTSTISWSVNGVVAQSGNGLTSMELATGSLGQPINLTVTIASLKGTFSQSTVIRSSEVDMLWQGETYTPPFYKGLALWSTQSRVTVMAIPHIILSGNTERDPTSLIYRWSKNGEVIGDQSGIGRNHLTFSDNILSQPQRIEVEVMTDQNTVVSRKALTLTPSRPSMLVYEQNPFYGLMLHQESSGSYLLGEGESTFAAFPLFFDTTSRLDPNLMYEWKTNSGEVENRESVTYRAPENRAGSSRVNIKVQNSDKITQTASKSFLIQFGK